MKNITQIILLLFLFLALLLTQIAPIGFRDPFLILIGSIAIFSYVLTVNCIVRECHRFSWVGLFNFFCLGFLVVHFHNPVLSCFIEEIRVNKKYFYSVDHVCSSAAISLVGFLSFLNLYVFFKVKRRYNQIDKRVSTIPLRSLNKLVPVFGIMAWVFMLLFILFAGDKYRSGIYSGAGDYWGSGATYVFLLFRIFLFSSIILDFYRLHIQYERLSIIQFLLRLSPIQTAVALAFMLLSAYVGDRGPILQIAILYAGVYGVFFGKIRL